MINKIIGTIATLLAILIALTPLNYFINYNRNEGFLELKPDNVIYDMIWNIGFYTHIVTGGISLLIGWAQFLPKFRNKYLRLHRFIGIIYVISFILCGLSSVVISLYATGGFVAGLGFGIMGIISFYTTFVAFLAVKNKDIWQHEKMMIYSYACCFAAVTFRLWQVGLHFTGLEYITLYKIAAWIGWLPNLVVAYWIVKRKEQKQLAFDTPQYFYKN